MFLVVTYPNPLCFYALLEGRELVEVNSTSGVASIGFPIQKGINKLDAKTLFLLPKYLDAVQHITIGDKNGYYHMPFGGSEWAYVETKV